MTAFNIECVKSYASHKNVEAAVAKKGFDDLRYFIMPTEDGRFFPVFVGMAAVDRLVHFHFNVVA